jgi:hypothetical protein
MTITTPTHADRLAAAAAITQKARHEIEIHEALAATVHRLKAAAVAGELDDAGAGQLVKEAEALRISEIVQPRRRKALDDATEAEVKVALDVLADLGAQVDELAKEAAQAADALSAALVDPAAAAIRGDTTAGYDRDRGRSAVEAFMPGVYGAAVLADRIRTASQTTFGAVHVPAEAAAIVAAFDAELAAIRSGTAMLKSILKAAQKARD